MRVVKNSAKAAAVTGALAGLITAGVIGHARPSSGPAAGRMDAAAGFTAPTSLLAPSPTPTPSSTLSPSPTPTPTPTPVPRPGAPDLLDPVRTASMALPSAEGIAQAISPYLGDLGGRHAIAVSVDGELVYSQNGDEALIPASTTKLFTAAAALTMLGPDARFTTSVRRGAELDEIVLVGGGDPLLASRTADAPRAAATLEVLADQTAAALRRAGQMGAVLRFDASLFGGPTTAPGWRASYTAAGAAVVGRISALTVDGGRGGKAEARVRASDPAAVAAAAFADLLEKRGITVTLAGPAGAAPAGQRLAETSSPPLTTMIEVMLADSDNDLAEVIARHVALARGEPATFAGAATAILAAIGALGVDIGDVSLYDGSGLSRRNAITPRSLVQILTVAGAAEHPELRPLLTGLPVAGFNGTLDERGSDGVAAGVVRAKTGTLDGVNALAGITPDTDGRLLVFAVLADRVGSPARAVDALDAIAGALAGCGCR